MGFLSGALDAVGGLLGGGGGDGGGSAAGGVAGLIGGFLARGSVDKAVDAYRDFSRDASDAEIRAMERALQDLEATYPKEFRQLQRATHNIRAQSGRAIRELRKALPRETFAERGLRREASISEAELTPAQQTALEDLRRETTAGLASAGARGAGRAGIAAKFDTERRFRENALEANRARRLGALTNLGSLQAQRQGLEAGVRGDIAGARERLGVNLANIDQARQDVYRRRGETRAASDLGIGESRAAHKLRLGELEFGGALGKGRASQQIAGSATDLGGNILKAGLPLAGTAIGAYFGGPGGAAIGSQIGRGISGIFEEGGPVPETGPALVHQGEHVFTDEAVRGAGGGNPRLGHIRLQDLMQDLEQRGSPGSMGAVERVLTEDRKLRIRNTGARGDG